MLLNVGSGGGAAAAAPAASGAAATGGAAAAEEAPKEEAKEEGMQHLHSSLPSTLTVAAEKEESDEDMGFGLFD